MSRLAVPGQRSMQPPARGPAGGRTAMRTGTGIFLITTGAILLFALRAGSPQWLNLHVVGLILIVTGALGLLLPRLARGPLARGPLARGPLARGPLARGPLYRDRLRRWVRPGQLADPAPARAAPGSYDDRPAQATDTNAPGDSPTTLNDLLAGERPLV